MLKSQYIHLRGNAGVVEPGFSESLEEGDEYDECHIFVEHGLL